MSEQNTLFDYSSTFIVGNERYVPSTAEATKSLRILLEEALKRGGVRTEKGHISKVGRGVANKIFDSILERKVNLVDTRSIIDNLYESMKSSDYWESDNNGDIVRIFQSLRGKYQFLLARSTAGLSPSEKPLTLISASERAKQRRIEQGLDRIEPTLIDSEYFRLSQRAEEVTSQINETTMRILSEVPNADTPNENSGSNIANTEPGSQTNESQKITIMNRMLGAVGERLKEKKGRLAIMVSAGILCLGLSGSDRVANTTPIESVPTSGKGMQPTAQVVKGPVDKATAVSPDQGGWETQFPLQDADLTSSSEDKPSEKRDPGESTSDIVGIDGNFTDTDQRVSSVNNPEQAINHALSKYIANSQEEAIAVAQEMNFIGPESNFEHPSNMCGPLAASVLRDLNILPEEFNIDPTSFWLATPSRINTLLPENNFSREHYNVGIKNVEREWKVGDFVYLRGGTYDHMITISRVDTDGKIFALSNYRNAEGRYIIHEFLLKDPTDPTVGLFNEWSHPGHAGMTGITEVFVWSVSNGVDKMAKTDSTTNAHIIADRSNNGRAKEVLAYDPHIDFPVGIDYPLAKDYVPPLGKLNDYGVRVVPAKINSDEGKGQPVAAQALASLFQDAKYAGINDLYVTSGYRSYGVQLGLYNKNKAKYGEQQMVSAAPGTSEHQSGLAFDLTTRSIGYAVDVNASFENTPAGLWLLKNDGENLAKHGFVITYPAFGVADGRPMETWHIRYVGVQIAQGLRDQKYMTSPGADKHIIHYLAQLQESYGVVVQPTFRISSEEKLGKMDSTVNATPLAIKQYQRDTSRHQAQVTRTQGKQYGVNRIS